MKYAFSPTNSTEEPKILALQKIVELGGSPVVNITLNDETHIEGYFDSIDTERGIFRLNIQTSDNRHFKIWPLSIKDVSIIDQDSEHITEESILKMIKFDAEIEEYLRINKIGGGGIA
jgi:hypothetical protein